MKHSEIRCQYSTCTKFPIRIHSARLERSFSCRRACRRRPGSIDWRVRPMTATSLIHLQNRIITVSSIQQLQITPTLKCKHKISRLDGRLQAQYTQKPLRSFEIALHHREIRTVCPLLCLRSTACARSLQAGDPKHYQKRPTCTRMNVKTGNRRPSPIAHHTHQPGR
jgi:hypothetical protein